MSAGTAGDPSLFVRALGKGTVFGRKGISIRYWLFGDTGDPMVLCNGLFSSPVVWDRFVEHFSRSHRVLLWEYPGHGVSVGPDPGNDTSIGLFAEACLVLLEGVGIDAAVFVGYGLGVQVILETYRRRPEAVKAMVGVCGAEEGRLSRIAPFQAGRQIAARTLERFLVPLGTPFWKALRLLWIATLPLRREEAGSGRQAGSGLEQGKVWLDQVSRTEPQAGLRSLASTLFYHPGSLLPRIRVPVLILGGGEDRVVPTNRYVKMTRRIPGCRLVLLEGCSHLAMVQAPDKVHACVEAFLAEEAVLSSPSSAGS